MSGDPATVTATVETTCGDIELELLADKAPQTVASFAFLAEEGYWDGSACHRLTTQGIFVLQCGDPTGTGRGNPGYGFGIENAPEDAPDRLREYVVGTSIAKFMFLDGLAFKVWRMREREWFEGTYVFDSEQERKVFREEFEATAAESKGSELIGSPPVSIEEFEVVAIAEGPAGFRRGAGPHVDAHA